MSVQRERHPLPRRWWAFAALALFLALPWPAHAATYHVSPTGSDSAPCGASPRRTIAGGVACLRGGDTLLVKAGTYDELVANIPSGTASQPTIVKSETPRGAVIQPSASRQGQLFNGVGVVFFQQQNYITLDGFVIDGAHLTHVELIANGTGDKTGAGSGWISIVNNELRNGHDGGYPNSFGITVAQASHDWRIAGNDIHHVGADAAIPQSQDARQSYGIYFTGQHSVIENNEIAYVGGYGLHMYNTMAGSNGNIIQNNRIHHNGLTVGQAGVLYAAGGSNNQFHHNLVYANGGGVLVGMFGSASANNTLVNNTIYGNKSDCLLGRTEQLVLRNNLCVQNAPDVLTSMGGASWVMDHNGLGGDPLFVNAGAGNFELRPGSPAIDAGVLVGLPYAGKAPDLGACEVGLGCAVGAPARAPRRPAPYDLRVMQLPNQEKGS